MDPGAYGGPKGPTLGLMVMPTDGTFEIGTQIIWLQIDGFLQRLDLNPNWHEAGRIYPTYNFWIGFCQLNFYQKFPNIIGGEN